MDKAEFIALAPQYYGLAIVVYLREHGTAYRQQLIERWPIFMRRDRLFDSAVVWLSHKGMITLIPDAFGPTIINTSDDFYIHWDSPNNHNEFSALAKYKIAGEAEGWLSSALGSVEEDYRRLGISDADFDEPDKEWEPLALERQDPQLQEAIAAVDDTIEKVRADNGYSANLPEERDYVLDSLSAVSKRLKEASTVSLAYLREFAFAPLSKLFRRFKDAAIGLAASVAKEGLAEAQGCCDIG